MRVSSGLILTHTYTHTHTQYAANTRARTRSMSCVRASVYQPISLVNKAERRCNYMALANNVHYTRACCCTTSAHECVSMSFATARVATATAQNDRNCPHNRGLLHRRGTLLREHSSALCVCVSYALCKRRALCLVICIFARSRKHHAPCTHTRVRMNVLKSQIGDGGEPQHTRTSNIVMCTHRKTINPHTH